MNTFFIFSQHWKTLTIVTSSEQCCWSNQVRLQWWTPVLKMNPGSTAASAIEIPCTGWWIPPASDATPPVVRRFYLYKISFYENVWIWCLQNLKCSRRSTSIGEFLTTTRNALFSSIITACPIQKLSQEENFRCLFYHYKS